ncbi:MAG: carboxypeptidase-like regulatory domain-containing protein [Singulisphaera sp.]
MRLVRDDVPIRGRVLDSQGRPVAGVTISAREIRDVDAGVDKEALLASGAIDFGRTAAQYNGPTWLGERGTWTTDADGRFEVRGVGRDRIVGLELRSPTLEKVYLYAMARESQAPPKPRPRATRPAMSVGLPPAPPLVGRDLRADRRTDQADHRARPVERDGQAARGVHVLGDERATSTEVSALTDAQGRFLLVGLPKAGSYEVRVAPRSGIDPFLAATVTVTDTEGLKPIETELAVPRG